MVVLRFEVECETDRLDIADLGEEMAIFLQESIFNGEDIIDVRYIGGAIN